MTIRLPDLHTNQIPVSEDGTRFKVLDAGRRWGKSRLALQEIIDRAVNKGQNVWYLGPTFNNVLPMWRDAKRLIGDLATYKNEQQKFMEFAPPPGTVTRGAIAFKSGDRPDNLRGSGLDFVVLDEAAYMPYEVWTDVVYPALIDKHGSSLIISTPNGMANWFYNVYLKGSDHDEPEWKSWHFTTGDNPFISADDIKQARKDMPALKFAQEIMADFVTDAANVFRGLDAVCTGATLDGPRDDFTYFAGVDWGRHNDFTVVSIFERETSRQVALVRFTDIGYQLQKNRITTEVLKWKLTKVVAEGNSMGAPLIEALQQEGLPIVGVYMTNPTKNALVEKLAVNIERGLITLLSSDDPVGSQQRGELNAFEMTRTRGGLNYTYRAAKGWHDDIVIATMLANSEIDEVIADNLVFATNPFYGGKASDAVKDYAGAPVEGDLYSTDWKAAYQSWQDAGKGEIKSRFLAYQFANAARDIRAAEKEERLLNASSS